MGNNKVAVIAGTTGLVGGYLLRLLSDDPFYTSIIALTRHPITELDTKVKNLIVEFENLDSEARELKADHVFCCLGTTMKKAGSKDAFRKVDYEYPLKLAQITQKNGASHFSLVTALGANVKSSFFYNRVKGEVEKSIGELNLNSFYTFRPSLILGKRKESRILEEVGQTFASIISFALVGPLRKYKAVNAESIAGAMQYHAKKCEPGNHVIQSGEILEF